MNLDHLMLNDWSATVAEDLIANHELLGCDVHDIAGAQVIDCGVRVRGSLEAGQLLSLMAIADTGDIEIHMDRLEGRRLARITVTMAEPVVGCLLAQYAGWKIHEEDYFAMGSGPMRAVLAQEPIFDHFQYDECDSNIAVGIIEASSLPSEAVIRTIAQKLEMHPDSLILAVARTASLAGSFQVVARSIETCMHKLHEIGFDVAKVRSAIGSAFLPPIPKDDLTAVGRTNDSILYGGEVILWVDAEDDEIAEAGKRLPSSTSPDFGRPFIEIFKAYDGDFYKIDPNLFSPAAVTINNLRTGSVFDFGAVEPSLVLKSFFTG